MALYLVQHGQNLAKEQDPEQSLSSVGIAEVERIARLAAEKQIKVDLINHSEKKRALQTARIFAQFLQPEKGVVQVEGLNPLDDVVKFSHKIDCPANAMIVGHLPFLEKLCAYLITGSTEKKVCKFQNGGIVCLAQDTSSKLWSIVWTLFPAIC